MKIIFFLATLSLAPAFAETNEEALAKARTLFPEFRNHIFNNQDKADEAFEPFLEMPKKVQLKLLKWLDEEYLKLRKACVNAQPVKRASRSFSRNSTVEEVKSLQKEMERIRSIASEGEMKKELKLKGWATLKQLLKAEPQNKSRKIALLRDPKEIEAAAEKFGTVAQYRYRLRNKMSLDVKEVSREIENLMADVRLAKQQIEHDRNTQMVLDANEDLKSQISKVEYDGILEVNKWRIACGLDPLKIDPKLCLASRDHSKDMATKGFFSHTSPVPGKKTLSDRAKNFGTSGSGENIAINHSMAESNKAWFFSPGHHKNMFRARYTVIGLGVYGRHYTQMFR